MLFTVIRNVGATIGRTVILRRKTQKPQVIKPCFPLGNPEIANNLRLTGNVRPYNGVVIYSRKQQFTFPTASINRKFTIGLRNIHCLSVKNMV